MTNDTTSVRETDTTRSNNDTVSLSRPYLVIPKLIEQPTWGGDYIVRAKGWSANDRLAKIKIGQSYELFSGTNLSLLSSTDDDEFQGEFTDNQAVANLTQPANALGLRDLLRQSPEGTLGKEVIAERGDEFALLIKYTQALGNSFQAHIRDGVTHPVWKPKPESWYYFEPGLITLGAKPGIDWQAYQAAVEAVQSCVINAGDQVRSGSLTYELAREQITKALETYDPWQYVNTVGVEKDQLVDLSSGGLHHSWEEDSVQAPLGNVLYELQSEAMDNVSTFRSFDKGKIGRDGTVRSLQIKEYFEAIDRSPGVNDPSTHFRKTKPISRTEAYELGQLLETKHYNLQKLTLLNKSAMFTESIGRYKHLFVKEGRIEVSTARGTVIVGTAHSCFVPAESSQYSIKNLAPRSEVLVSY